VPTGAPATVTVVAPAEQRLEPSLSEPPSVEAHAVPEERASSSPKPAATQVARSRTPRQVPPAQPEPMTSTRPAPPLPLRERGNNGALILE